MSMKYAKVGEFVVCPKCWATAMSASPHGDGNPCPLAVSEHEAMLASQERMLIAEIERADAQRMSAIKAGVNMEDLAAMLRRLITGDDPEG